jgi:hypothetical protein
MEEGIFTWMGLLDCSLWSHPLRIGRTQSGLLPLVASSSQLPYSKPFKNISFTDVFAFSCSSAKSSKLVSRLRTKKPALFVRAL